MPRAGLGRSSALGRFDLGVRGDRVGEDSHHGGGCFVELGGWGDPWRVRPVFQRLLIIAGFGSFSTLIGRWRAVPSCCTDGAASQWRSCEGSSGTVTGTALAAGPAGDDRHHLLCAPVSWIDDGITPSWVVYPIALVIALSCFRSGHGALLVAIAALVFLIVHLPWSGAAITGAENNPLDRESPSSPVQ